MAQNTSPIFALVPKIQWGTVTAANTNKDGTGTVTTIFTADAVDGSFVHYIRIRAAGTNVQTVVRVFLNNGSTNATASNNTLFTELFIAATTGTETAAQPEHIIPMNLALPPGYKVNVVISQAIAAGLHFTAVGGDY